MAEKVEFSNEELILAIQTAVQEAPEFDPRTFTTSEYADIVGISNDLALKELKKIARTTKLIVPELRVRRITFWNYETKVRGWRYVGPDIEFDSEEVE